MIMNEQEFIDELTDLMDTECELTMDLSLEDIEEWDSLSYVSFLAMSTKVLNKRVEPKLVRSAKTVRDLYNIIKG